MQVGFVEAKVVVGQQALQSRINLHVIVVIDSANVAAAIVDGAFELTWRNKNKQ